MIIPQFNPPDDGGKSGQPGALAARYLIPPFSVLDGRSKWWAERKRAWLDVGIKSHLGRDDNLTFSMSAQPPDAYAKKQAYEIVMGRKVSWVDFAAAVPGAAMRGGTSVFDPVLCELIYRWFSRPGAMVLDPFAGGAVRGMVAAALGRRYIGIDIRHEQVGANDEQWLAAGQWPMVPAPVWRVGDARDIAQIASDACPADLLFSCPPYADLERYSDLPADLSTMRYPQFLEAYRAIIKASAGLLADDRFACVVVGDIRDSKGFYRGFVGDTVAAFRAAGLDLYNEAILLTPLSSLAIRADKPFRGSRKLGRAHQHVLVFVKGSPVRATAACGRVC